MYETEAFLTNEEALPLLPFRAMFISFLKHPPHTQFALVRLEKSLVAPLHAIAIASHLDTDLSTFA